MPSGRKLLVVELLARIPFSGSGLVWEDWKRAAGCGEVVGGTQEVSLPRTAAGKEGDVCNEHVHTQASVAGR